MRRSNRLASRAIAEAGGDLLAMSMVVQYLGIRGLVSIGTTCRYLRDAMYDEIERRRERSSDIHAEVKRLMIMTHREMTDTLCLHGKLDILSRTTVNVDAVRGLHGEAKRWIDDEIDYHIRFGREWTWDSYPERERDPFRVERMWLIEQRKRLDLHLECF